MLFVTFQYAIFLVALLLLLQLLRDRRDSAWNPVLLGASLLFYTLWIPAYLPLLLADIGVSYVLLRRMMAAEPGSARRRVLFALLVAFTLSLLLYFKYAVFLLESALPILRATLAVDFALPEILLPLGISFYTFQIISLAADLFPGDDPESEPPVGSLSRYALHVAFFPQLIAGPILRGSELLPQLERGARPNAERARRGLWLIASGVTKKAVFADFLLAPFADSVFDGAGIANAPFHWVGLYAFSFQIYFDFSGYTDIARGTALLIGFELPDNFREPFLARGPQEFWQRWHITLSRWLRLYLFTPISHTLMRRGGPRWDGPAIPVAQLVTMTLCGLWHGAGWNFVLWGALQGVLLVAWRLPNRAYADRIQLRDVPHILLFYHLFCLTLVVFRCPDLATAGSYFHGLFVGSELPGWPRLATLVVVTCAGLHCVERWVRPRLPQVHAWVAARGWAPFAEATALGALAGVAVMVSGAGSEFIYFQF